MDGLALLLEARQMGLDVQAKGEQLLIRGPRSQERLVRTLLNRKQEVLTALKTELQAQVHDSQNTLPCLDRNGVLVIPFGSPKRFHWWNGGQGLLATLAELGASEQIIKRYIPGRNGNNGQNPFERN